jgi:hypothetical protein
MKKLVVMIMLISIGISGCVNNEKIEGVLKPNEEVTISEVEEKEGRVVEEQEGDKEIVTSDERNSREETNELDGKGLLDSFRWIKYTIDINEPKMLDQVSCISGSITIPEGDEVTILDHALYIDGKPEKWSYPLALHGDVREIKDSGEPGKHYIIVFNAPSELIDFSDERLSLTLYVSMEVDGYRLSFMEGNQKSLLLPAKPRELDGLGWINGMKIIAEYNNTGDNPYEVMLVQTEVLTPLTRDDEGFDMYLSGFYGGFELWLVKEGEVVDSLKFNECFGYEKIGFVGTFPINGADYNDDGNLDFNIGIIDKRGSGAIVFTVKDDSFHVFTFDGSKIFRRINPHHSEPYLRGSEGELSIEHFQKEEGGEYYLEKYYWDGMQFISKEGD